MDGGEKPNGLMLNSQSVFASSDSQPVPWEDLSDQAENTTENDSQSVPWEDLSDQAENTTENDSQSVPWEDLSDQAENTTEPTAIAIKKPIGTRFIEAYFSNKKFEGDQAALRQYRHRIMDRWIRRLVWLLVIAAVLAVVVGLLHPVLAVGLMGSFGVAANTMAILMTVLVAVVCVTAAVHLGVLLQDAWRTALSRPSPIVSDCKSKTKARSRSLRQWWHRHTTLIALSRPKQATHHYWGLFTIGKDADVENKWWRQQGFLFLVGIACVAAVLVFVPHWHMVVAVGTLGLMLGQLSQMAVMALGFLGVTGVLWLGDTWLHRDLKPQAVIDSMPQAYQQSIEATNARWLRVARRILFGVGVVVLVVSVLSTPFNIPVLAGSLGAVMAHMAPWIMGGFLASLTLLVGQLSYVFLVRPCVKYAVRRYHRSLNHPGFQLFLDGLKSGSETSRVELAEQMKVEGERNIANTYLATYQNNQAADQGTKKAADWCIMIEAMLVDVDAGRLHKARGRLKVKPDNVKKEDWEGFKEKIYAKFLTTLADKNGLTEYLCGEGVKHYADLINDLSKTIDDLSKTIKARACAVDHREIFEKRKGYLAAKSQGNGSAVSNREGVPMIVSRIMQIQQPHSASDSSSSPTLSQPQQHIETSLDEVKTIVKNEVERDPTLSDSSSSPTLSQPQQHIKTSLDEVKRIVNKEVERDDTFTLRLFGEDLSQDNLDHKINKWQQKAGIKK